MHSRGQLAAQIAGEIVVSAKPGEVMRHWRLVFRIAQKEIANTLNIRPSVISDYETGRRKSPGAAWIRDFVLALLALKSDHPFTPKPPSSEQPHPILHLSEFTSPRAFVELTDHLKGTILTSRQNVPIEGITVVDSLTAILHTNTPELLEIYGRTTERALIFLSVSRGRSPLIAIKVTNLKPNAIILQGVSPRDVDKLAIRLAEAQNIALAVTPLSHDEILTQCNTF